MPAIALVRNFSSASKRTVEATTDIRPLEKFSSPLSVCWSGEAESYSIIARSRKVSPDLSSGKIAANCKEQNLRSTTLPQQYIKNAGNYKASYADRRQNFIEREKDENEKAGGANETDHERRGAMMFAHPERETNDSREQENNQQPQQDRVVNQKAESDCRQDRQQRGKAKTAERGEHRTHHADFVGVSFPKTPRHDYLSLELDGFKPSSSRRNRAARTAR